MNYTKWEELWEGERESWSYPIDYFTSFSSTYEAEKLHVKNKRGKIDKSLCLGVDARWKVGLY